MKSFQIKSQPKNPISQNEDMHKYQEKKGTFFRPSLIETYTKRKPSFEVKCKGKGKEKSQQKKNMKSCDGNVGLFVIISVW